MSPVTAASTGENDATEVVVKSFDLFHDRVDRAFRSMNPSSSSSKSSEFWRTSAVLAIRLPGGKHIEDDEKEEEEEEDEEEERERTRATIAYSARRKKRGNRSENAIDSIERTSSTETI